MRPAAQMAAGRFRKPCAAGALDGRAVLRAAARDARALRMSPAASSLMGDGAAASPGNDAV
jgi:hypothetical protein